jgi:hypothetical protein
MIHVEKHVLRDGSLHVSLSGEIDDHFDGTRIAADVADGKRVVIHLAGVRSLTSVGVRNFDDFVNAFGDHEVALIHVSPAIAAQLVMIPTLCPKARVETAKLPFSCPSCATEVQHSIPWKPRAHLTHAPKCKCGASMELDGLAEQYLPVE